jgi:hypothetical protein
VVLNYVNVLDLIVIRCFCDCRIGMGKSFIVEGEEVRARARDGEEIWLCGSACASGKICAQCIRITCSCVLPYHLAYKQMSTSHTY